MKIFGFKVKKLALISSILAVFAAGFGGYLIFVGGEAPGREAVEVVRGTVVQEVSVIGKVKAVEQVDLSFERAGRISAIYVNVGEEVTEDSVLLELDAADLEAQLREAEATMRSQEAKLEELARGTRPEEIAVYESKALNARTALIDAKKNAIDTLQDAYSRADDAVRNKLDAIFLYPRTSSPQINFFLVDSELENFIELNRYLVENSLVAWRSSLDAISTVSDLGAEISSAEKSLQFVKNLLEKAALAVNTIQSSSSVSQSTLDTWRSNVSSARTSTNTAILNTGTAREKLNTGESNLLVAENELILKRAGATPEEFAAQEAQVEQASAAVENYRVQLRKTAIRAPISGVVAREDVKRGEIVPANTPVIFLINKDNLEIETHIPEVDIAKIKIGDRAMVTLDAYGSDVRFEALVRAIEPAETVIEGVSTYKTTLYFVKMDPRIRSGMTANIDVLTAEKKGTLLIPARSLIRRDGSYFVLVETKKDIAPEERQVMIGIRGSDGNVEITSGLLEGDRVLR